MQGSSEIFGKRSVSFFKNPMPISASRAAAKKRNFFCVGLRQTLIDSLKAVMTLLILMPGRWVQLSFSAVGECKSAMGDESTSNAARTRDLLVGYGA